jgi:hypothetical protein
MGAKLPAIGLALAALGLSSCAAPQADELPVLRIWDPCKGVPNGLFDSQLSGASCSDLRGLTKLVIHPVHKSARAKLLNAHSEEPLWHPLAGGMIAVLGTSASESVVSGKIGPEFASFPRREKLPKFPDAVLWRAAKHNLDLAAARAHFGEGSPHFITVDLDVDRNSLALSDVFWRRAEFSTFRGDPAFGFGSRNQFWIVDSADPIALARLHRQIRQDVDRYGSTEDNYPDFHSPDATLFIHRRDGTWEPLPNIYPPRTSISRPAASGGEEALRPAGPSTTDHIPAPS